MTDAVSIKGLSHSYRSHLAVDNISFSIADSSIHGFVGPNGAGKTTTLKVLATLMEPNQGDVRVFGLDIVKDSKQARRMIGFMPDHFSMYRQMTVEEYLDFFAAAYGLQGGERQQVVADVLALTDMDGRRRSLIRGLSRGMQQRVCLARVLVHDPKLLLLDEPASGLDPRARIELMEVLRELQRMGKTIFISSHILSELSELCDDVTIVDRGRVKYSGSMDGLLKSREGEQACWRLKIALIEDEERLDAFITALSLQLGVDAVDMDGDDVVLISGDHTEVDVNALLWVAIEQQVSVIEFREDSQRLDQAFMDLTTAGVRD